MQSYSDDLMPSNKDNATTLATQEEPTFTSGLQHIAQEGLAVVQEMTNPDPDSLAQKKEASNNVKLTPGPLPAKGKEFPDIISNLENLVDSEELENKLDVFPILDICQTSAVASHAIAAYVSVIEGPLLRQFVARVVSDVTLWVSRLFRFFESSASFHEEPREGLLKICRLLLRIRYPKFVDEGFETLYPRPPVIYVSASTRSGLGQYLCANLGFPRSCISVVSCNTVFGSQFAMDISVLERMVQEDVAAQKVPLLLIAHAGVPSVGQVDNLLRLKEICNNHNIWLHVEGHSLAGLCLVPAPNLPAKISDSLTLPLGQWLGIPSLPYITLYKSIDATLALSSGLSSFSPIQRLSCLPTWVILQQLGSEAIVAKIKHSFELSHRMIEILTGNPSVRVLGKESGRDQSSLTDIANKAVSTSVLFDVLTPTVVFQYIIDVKEPDGSSGSSTVPSTSYCNSLNSWLGQILQRDVPKVHVDVIEVERFGICVRFSPLESAQAIGTTVEDVEGFLECLGQQVEILKATVRHKDTFLAMLNQNSSLQLVVIPNWAGLGGVRYIPSIYKDNLIDLPDSAKEDVNKINRELVAILKNTDSAFSLGEGEDGLLCVRFGMVTEDTDMEELLSLVSNTGKEIEESSKYLETMAEVVKKGIETAYEDLRKENEEKVWQEGVLRQVPLIGSFVNWWSPMPKETGIKGRSFNLSSGVIESTENTYKYHMQINQDAGTFSPTPLPSVQTPVQVKSEHSRSSSRSSTSTQQVTPQTPALAPTPTPTADSGESKKIEQAAEAT